MQTLSNLLSHPVLGPILPVVGAAVPMTLLLCYIGLGFLVGTLQVTGERTRRSSYGKAAKQAATVALILGWLLLVASRVCLFFVSDTYVPNSLVATFIELSWGIFGFAVIATSIHFAVWRFLDKHRILHSLLAFLAGINGLFGSLCILGALRLRMASELPNATELTLGDIYIFQIGANPILYAILGVITLAVAMPAAAALIWLVIRRRRDDFGRDYYTATMKWIANWGFAAWIPALIIQAGIVFLEIRPLLSSGAPLETMTLIQHALRFVPALLSCLCLGAISKADVPMRLKPLTWIALLLSAPAAYFVFKDATTFLF